ncbi:SH3 domain-containing protein [Candidatus Woesebacteria bacterium]|nr:SH3 domain-containing protein [Candidatus Woesebacteria bacterium]
MRTLKNVLKLVCWAFGATVLLFLPSYMGEAGKWVIPGALVVLIGIKYRKNTIVNVGNILLFALTCYLVGGAQYGLPSQVTDILDGADKAIFQMEAARLSQIQGAQSLVLSTTGIVKIAVERFQKPINITQVQAKTEPEQVQVIDVTPTLEPTLVPPQPEVEVQVTLTWDGTTCQPEKVEVLPETANVRKEPSRSATVLAVAKKGDEVTVLASNLEGWFHVVFEGQMGWMHNSTINQFTCKAP